MAKYGKNNYFDGVVLPEPKEEMLRRMAKGVKLGYNKVSTASGAIKMVSPGIPMEFAEPLPSEVGNIAARPFNSIVGVNLAISSDRLSASGTLISTIAKPNGGSMIIFQASGAISISISSISFTPAVCIAEYLPHNLIPTAEGSVVKWLDSAPQLPEANGILPPLDASVGGYDLAAIGNPKIII